MISSLCRLSISSLKAFEGRARWFLDLVNADFKLTNIDQLIFPLHQRWNIETRRCAHVPRSRGLHTKKDLTLQRFITGSCKYDMKKKNVISLRREFKEVLKNPLAGFRSVMRRNTTFFRWIALNEKPPSASLPSRSIYGCALSQTARKAFM